MSSIESRDFDRRYRLRGRVGPKERSFFLSPGENRIGSSEDNDLVLAVSGVSRHHARLRWRAGELPELADLGSKNGTRVNGGPFESGRIHAGDELRIGPVELRLEEIDARDAHLALILMEAKAMAEAPFPADQSTAVQDAPSAPAAPPAQPALVFPPGYVAGRSSAMERLHRAMESYLDSGLPVLIEGETGAGKELVARTLHLSSSRSGGPFVAVNCAAIPSELLEAEMFGIGEGVATGVRKRAGKFRKAQGGTLFLDEIGEMLPELQAKLLRALQEREIQPVGAAPVKVDVWVVAASNVDLEKRVSEGSFRRDLYYRVAGFVLTVPPLRERADDVPLLLEHFLRGAAKISGKSILGVTAKALDILAAYPWPGNVRELEHEARRLAHLVGDGQAIESGLLARRFLQAAEEDDVPAEAGSLRLRDHVEAAERRVIVEALGRAGGSQRKAARLLGIARSTLVRKVREHGIPT